MTTKATCRIYVRLCTSDKERAIFCVTSLLDFVRLLVNNSFQSEPEDPRVPPSAPLGEEQEFHTSSQLIRARTN
jgi:hypothetical protein